jgi:hypothetical protein
MNQHMVGIADVVERLRQPEYRGANRCAPCTAVNLLIAAAIASMIAVLTPFLAIATFVVFVAIIYLRGYLVPGTPTLTKRYLPASVLRLFDKQSSIEHSVNVEQTKPADSETAGSDNAGTAESLAAAGVIGQIGTDDIDLIPTFRGEWRERVRARREHAPEAEDLRAMFNAEDVSRHGKQFFVVDGNVSVRWESEAALVADIAAVSILENCLNDWATLDRDRQRSVLSGLRLCLEQCPSCDGSVDVTKDRVDPCCQNPHLIVDSVCENCGTALANVAVVDSGEDESVRLRLLQS